MTKLEKKALLDVLSQIESQKNYVESFIPRPLVPSEDIVDDLPTWEYYLGSLNAYRSCLAVLKSYFC